MLCPLYLPGTRFICLLNPPAPFEECVGDFIYIATRYCRCAPSGRAEEGWRLSLRFLRV